MVCFNTIHFTRNHAAHFHGRSLFFLSRSSSCTDLMRTQLKQHVLDWCAKQGLPYPPPTLVHLFALKGYVILKRSGVANRTRCKHRSINNHAGFHAYGSIATPFGVMNQKVSRMWRMTRRFIRVPPTLLGRACCSCCTKYPYSRVNAS